MNNYKPVLLILLIASVSFFTAFSSLFFILGSHISSKINSERKAQISDSKTPSIKLVENTIPSENLNNMTMLGLSTSVSTLSAEAWSQNPGVTYLTAFSDDVGIGTSSPNAKTEIQSTGEQLRLSYDATHYASFSVDLTGDITLTPTGSGAKKFIVSNGGTISLAGSVSSTSNYITAPNFSVTTSGEISAATSATINGITINSGTISSSTWQGSIIGSTYGGTGADLHNAAQGSIPYFSSTGVMSALVGSVSGRCLVSNGIGMNPSWQACSSGSTGINWWTVPSNTGSITPINSTLDFILGGQASASAKFGVLNMASTTPTASVSGGMNANNGIFLTADGSLATLDRQSLTLGNSSSYNSTGNVLINPNGTGNVGIGTTNPQQNLDVNGNARVSGYLTINGGDNGPGTINLSSEYNPIVDVLQLGLDGSGVLKGQHITSGDQTGTGAGSQISINPGPAAGIDQIGAYLTLADGRGTGTGGGGGIYFQTADALPSGNAVEAYSTKVVILGNGNVGIGAAAGTPGHLLQVISSTDSLTGSFINTKSSGIAIQGSSTGAGNSIGVYGTMSGSAVGNGVGVYGINTQSAATSAIGVEALSSGNNPADFGIYASAYGGGSGTNYGVYGYGAGTTSGTNIGGYFAAASGGSNYALITGTGNVGIGITTPVSKLEVGGSVAAQSIGTENELTLSRPINGGISYPQVATFQVGTYTDNTGCCGPSTRLDINLKAIANTTVSGDTNVMTLLSNGNVGIGSTVPTAKLDVNGTFKANSTITLSGLSSASGRSVCIDESNQLTICGANGNLWQRMSGSLAPINITDSLNLGGIATSSALVHLAGTNDVTDYSFFNGGNVGIGKTTPAFKLDITDSQASTSSTLITNSSTNASAKVLALKIGATTPGTGNYFASFLDGNGEILGKIRGTGTTNSLAYDSNGGDFAEYYRKETFSEPIEPGDLVCLTNTGKVTLCSIQNGQTSILGIVSDRAGFVGAGGHENDSSYILVGLVGQVPLKVTGKVNPSDPLTVSSIAGVAQKANTGQYIVARALEGSEKGMDTVLVTLSVGYYSPTFVIDNSGNIMDKSPESNSLSLNSTVASSSLFTPGVTVGGDDKIATLSAKLDFINDTVTKLLKNNSDQAAKIDSISGIADTLKKLNIISFASESATTDIVSINQGLMVFGPATLSDVSIENTLKVGGSLSITDNSINTIGTVLDIQPLKQGNITFMGRLVTIDTDGNITIKGSIIAQIVNTEKINISTPQDGKAISLGKATLPAGQTSVTIETTSISSNSAVFLTPETIIDTPLILGEKNPKNWFKVKTSKSAVQDTLFDWWIVN